MTELIAHEVEISAIDCSEGDKTYHLVQSNATVYRRIVVAFGHMPVHLVVDKTEYYSLVAYQSRVMAFNI